MICKSQRLDADWKHSSKIFAIANVSQHLSRIIIHCLINALIIIITSAVNRLVQHQATWGQHSYARSSSSLIYSKRSSLNPPRKFPGLSQDFLKPFFRASFHLGRGRPAFRLALGKLRRGLPPKIMIKKFRKIMFNRLKPISGGKIRIKMVKPRGNCNRFFFTPKCSEKSV